MKILRGARNGSWAILFALLLCAISAGQVLAEPEESKDPAPLLEVPAQGNSEGIDVKVPQPGTPGLTDLEAAEDRPLEGLARDEASEVLDAVFAPILKGLTGPFEELQPEKYLADNVAVIPAGDQPDPGSGGGGVEPEGPTLVNSTIPLRVEASNGKEEAIDLSLEAVDGEFRVANPLVDVGLPQELGDGIELPETGVRIDVDEAPGERSPSALDHNAIIYPNIAEDTDFAVAPAPTGFETLTHLRSAEAPRTQTLNLDLPEEAELKATEEGGAEVIEDGEALVGVTPPAALDAAGEKVPVVMEVSGDSLVLTVSPSESAQYPILVDPLIQSYHWVSGGPQTGITASTGAEQWSPETVMKGGLSKPAYVTETGSGQYGLHARGNGWPAWTGDHAAWIYTVPRYFSDKIFGIVPTSYISGMTLSGLTWWANSEYNSPYLTAGLWDVVNKNWVSLLSHLGYKGHSLNDTNWIYKFPNPNANTNVKLAALGLWANENTTGYNGASVRSTVATVELSEAATDLPGFGSLSGPSQWVDQAAAPINFTVSDSGLGVYAITVSNAQNSWRTAHGCLGVGGSPCPRTWKSTDTKPPVVKYSPSVLVQGIQTLQVVAEDPLGQKSTPGFVQVKVDHTAPGLALSGSMTEQAALGTKRASYALKLDATDGTTGSPQSGVVKTVVEVDGNVVDEASPGCSTQNCSVSREWILDASQYTEGQHSVKVTATDAVGRITTKTLSIELHTAAPPSATLSGTMTEQATVGVTRPRYVLKVDAKADPSSSLGGGAPAFASSFGSVGSSAGQLNKPADVAISASGAVFVADRFNNRIQKFDAEGKYVSQFGSAGSGNGQLSTPAGLAIDAQGNIWVADSGNRRVQKFDSEGKYLMQFGASGYGEGQFSPQYGPKGIGIDAQGNIWVSDYTSRVQKFSPTGTFLLAIGSFGESTGLDIGGGKVWVGDWTNNRVRVFSEAGAELFKVGSAGSGAGQFNHPDAVEVDSQGNAWIGDEGNSRVQQFNAQGDYVDQFGAAGSGSGQFKFAWPFGLTSDGKGSIWIADSNNHRIQRWNVSTPTSEIATLITIDGKQVLSNKVSCPTEGCSTTKQWILNSPLFATGEHTVQVKVTDGLGRVTTKALTIEIQRDVVKPTLEVAGELFEAPEGWVEQESYDLNATASDDGYGVTSLVFKIDGEAIASSGEWCLEGGCKASLEKSLNMSAYSGGAHSAQLIATDRANNSTTSSWTVNVDPDGHVSSTEAIETLEAVDVTSESSVVAATDEVLEPEQIEAGDNPGLQVAGSVIESTGTPTTTTMTSDPDDGFTIDSPDGETTITPVVNEGSENIEVAAGVAGVAANTKSEVDSVIRPQYNGVQTFQAIRSDESPDKFSWAVNLAEGQTLVLADSAHAMVLYSDGSTAFLITAEEAHDATGKAVPTYLEVSGNVLTLKVDFHSAQFVYPIIAGQGWETSYTVPVIVERPEDEFEIKQREEEEKLYEENNAPEPTEKPVKTPFSPKIGELILKPRVIGPTEYAAPPYPPSGGASISRIRVFTVEPNKVCGLHCDHWWANLRNPSFIRGSNWAHWENGTEVHCSTDNAWWFELTIFPSMPDPGCGFTGPSKVWKGEGKHLTIWGRYRIGALVATEFVEFEKVRYLSLQIWVWPNGFQQDRVGEWDCEGSNVPSYYC